MKMSHVAIATIPLLLTPMVGYLLAEGWISPGGGEKDVLLVFPLLLFALLFFLSGLVLIYRQWPLQRWTLRAAVVSTASMVILWIIAFGVSFLA